MIGRRAGFFMNGGGFWVGGAYCFMNGSGPTPRVYWLCRFFTSQSKARPERASKARGENPKRAG